MTTPDRPTFDISDQTMETVMLRIAQAKETPLVGYALPVMRRMERNHPPLFKLTEAIFKNVRASRIAFATEFGTTLAYDAISTQLESEERIVNIHENDLVQMKLDLLHHGQVSDLRRSSFTETVRSLRDLMSNWSKYDRNINWLIDLSREQTPMLFSLIQYFMIKGGAADIQEQTAMLQGTLPVLSIFYRRLGLMGQPEAPKK